jgi:hypothetical protein
MELSERALIVRLTISQWSARKYDKRASQQVADANGTTTDAGRFNKMLLPANDSLKQVTAAANALRKHVYDNTLPWAHDGQFIIPSKNYLEFINQYRQLKAEFDARVTAFMQDYSRVKVDAQRSLGTLYDAADYPDENDLWGKFGVDLEVMPVPTRDFRVSLADDELTRIHNDVVSRVESAQAAAMKAAWQRLYDRVEHMASTLTKDNPRIYDSMVDHIRELCKSLSALNLTDDAALEDMRLEVERKLSAVSVPLLREDETVRKATADTAEDIMERMRGFMGA